MAKWRRGGGGRRVRWVIEYVPQEIPITPKVIETQEPDPYTFDTPEAIQAALARLDQRLLEEKKPIADG